MIDPFGLRRRATELAGDVRMLSGAGLLRPMRPTEIAGLARELRHWGLTQPAVYGLSAAQAPEREALVDPTRRVTFAEFARRTNALANALAEDALSGQRVAVLGRNSVGFAEAVDAVAKLGADLLLLNTGFAGPQLADVVKREDAVAVLHDDEFTDAIGAAMSAAGLTVPCYPMSELARLASEGDPAPPPSPLHQTKPIILTSGTTGEPKGANRSTPRSVSPIMALLARIPYRVGDRVLIAAPTFHSWGFAHLVAVGALASTAVVRPRFDPEQTLATIDSEQITVLVVVPAMLQRIIALPADVRRQYDTSTLRIIATSGSELPGPLAAHVMDAFGDILYNLYGSTEVGWVSVASPTDLREAPGTAGVPLRGVTLRLLDGAGDAVPDGEEGRIFVDSPLMFDGYTGGGSKEVIAGCMSTGDIGRLDDRGRLFVCGREDDMIVSGGENIFPKEVEDEVIRLDGVAEAAVVGVPDDFYGQRLAAYVVRRDGAAITEHDIKDAVRSRLARYKVPREVVFVEELPRNATGKVLRRNLSSAAAVAEAAEAADAT
jgi:fatty-acyl-CoA synthase